MTPVIPQWAYVGPPAGWVRFGQLDPANRETDVERPLVRFAARDRVRGAENPAVWAGRVPVWASYTSGLVGGDRNLLIIRVLPQIELILMSDALVKPLEVRRAIQTRLSKARWPVRNWFVSHLVYLTRVTKKPRGDRWATNRLCMGRIPDRRGKFQQLAFIAIPPLAVNLQPAKKKANTIWDFEIQLALQPQNQEGWHAFAFWLAQCKPWERVIVFRSLSHLLPLDLVDMLERVLGQICWRIQNLSQPNSCSKLQLSRDVLCLAWSPPEAFTHSFASDQERPPEEQLFRQVLCGITRMPMPVVPVENQAQLTLEDVLSRLHWFMPHAFSSHGDLVGAEAARSHLALDLAYDPRTRTTRWRRAILPPRHDASS